MAQLCVHQNLEHGAGATNIPYDHPISTIIPQLQPPSSKGRKRHVHRMSVLFWESDVNGLLVPNLPGRRGISNWEPRQCGDGYWSGADPGPEPRRPVECSGSGSSSGLSLAGVEACLDLPVCCRAEGVPRGQARLVDGLKASYLADTSGNLNP